MTSDQPEPPPAAAGSWGDGALRSQHLDVDALSAYLDRQLTPEEMAAARAHLATCSACGRELAELRATVALLRELPQYLPRRTFQLGRTHARRRAGRGALGGWFERLVPAVPALRIATVAVAVLLVAVIAGDLVSNRGAGPGLVLQTGDQPAELVNAPADDALDAAPAPAMQAPAAEQARSRPAAIPTTSQPDADEEAASFAESAAEAGTESTVPASSMAGDDRAEDAPGVVSPAPAAEPEPASPPPSGWRLAQVGLGLALLWLIVSLAGVAWLRRDQSPDS